MAETDEDRAGFAAFDDASAKIFDVEIVVAVMRDLIAGMDRPVGRPGRFGDRVAQLDAMAALVATSLASALDNLREAEFAIGRAQIALQAA